MIFPEKKIVGKLQIVVISGKPWNCRYFPWTKHSRVVVSQAIYFSTSFAVKKREQDENNKPELSFVDSLLMMYKLRMKTTKAKAECRAYDNIRLYAHNLGDFVFY